VKGNKLRTKIGELTVSILLLSMLLPLLAYANPEFRNDLRLENGTVTGTVYDEVTSEVYGDVYVKVYNPSGVLVDTVTLSTYNVIDSTYKYYGFRTSVSHLFDYVRLGLEWNTLNEDGELVSHSSTVTTNVYAQNDDDNYSGGGGGGCISCGGIVGSDGKANAYQLEQLLKGKDVAELKITGDFVLLPASALSEGKLLRITGPYATYNLPLDKLDYKQLAEDLDIALENLYIRVEMKKASDELQQAISKDAAKVGASVKNQAIDFILKAVDLNGKEKTIDSLGKHFIERSFTLDDTIDATRTTVAMWSENGGLQFVPSIFEATADSKAKAVFKRNGNSIYVVVQSAKSFQDIQGHWAKGYIDTLANKLVVEGVSDTSFQPERSITRAEFAALVVRSIGLTRLNGNGGFKDVSSSAWYAQVVATASAAGIVEGYEDGTFRPDEEITREELAAMIVRAMDYTGNKTELTNTRQTQLLKRYNDAGSIVWGHKEVAIAIEAGIIEGMTSTTLSPKSDATRAQSATMLNRLLKKIEFIN
jgi:N-acetylmuramoyl-L-alanine amidase